MEYTIIRNNQIYAVIECPEGTISQQMETGDLVFEGAYPAHLYDYDPVNDVMASIVKDINLPATKAEIHRKELSENGYPTPSDVETIDAEGAYTLINLAFSRTLEKYISPGKQINTVYMFKEQATRQWIADGSVEADAPELLKSWFDNSDYATLAAAAQNIIDEADFMRGKVEAAERIRLEARAAILAATDNYESVIQPYIDDLETL